MTPFIHGWRSRRGGRRDLGRSIEENRRNQTCRNRVPVSISGSIILREGRHNTIDVCRDSGRKRSRVIFHTITTQRKSPVCGGKTFFRPRKQSMRRATRGRTFTPFEALFSYLRSEGAARGGFHAARNTGSDVCQSGRNLSGH